MAVFKTYSAVIRMFGAESPQHFSAIRKDDLTAPELALLAMIHGNEGLPVDQIFETGELEISSPDLREDLAARYSTANVNGRVLLGQAFGAVGTLPVNAEDAIPGLDGPPPIADGPNYNDKEREDPEISALLARAEETAKRSPGRPKGSKTGTGSGPNTDHIDNLGAETPFEG